MVRKDVPRTAAQFIGRRAQDARELQHHHDHVEQADDPDGDEPIPQRETRRRRTHRTTSVLAPLMRVINKVRLASAPNEIGPVIPSKAGREVPISRR